jgi:protein tyrosine phosphatase (PTP) superfamily phosphohydrolase (DUF442 family)
MDAKANRETAKLKLSTPNSDSAPQRSWQKSAAWGALVGLLAAVGIQVCHIVWWDNFHAIVPGHFYRSAHPSAAELERAIRRHGIRTVVNLRGICFGADFYMDECRATHDLNVSQEDVGLSAGRLPPVCEMRLLVRALDHSEYPILVHCRQGIDRTGLVSTLILLLYTDTDVKTARRQLGLTYGHVPLGRTMYMNQFFDLYEEWLGQQGLDHSRVAFRRWLENEYCPGPSRAELELVEVPSYIPLDEPWTVQVRAHNTSVATWHFRPGASAGIHCGCLLTNEAGKLVNRAKAGMFFADVSPGQSIDLTVAMPPIRVRGTYYLLIDMLEERQQSWFYQHGSKPLVQEIRIGP